MCGFAVIRYFVFDLRRLVLIRLHTTTYERMGTFEKRYGWTSVAQIQIAYLNVTVCVSRRFSFQFPFFASNERT